MDVNKTVQDMLDEALQMATGASQGANTPEAKAAYARGEAINGKRK